MKKIITLFSVLLLIALVGNSFAGDPDETKDNGFKYNVLKKERLNKDAVNAQKELNIKMGKPIDIYFDFQLGFGSTNAAIDNAKSTGSYETSSKGGFVTAGFISLSLFDVISFTSGLQFNGKSFSFSAPVTDTAAIKAFGKGSQDYSNTYMNIPLNINVGGMITDKFGLTFWGGPYIGIKLNSSDNSGFGYKNFDLGLNGTLTGNYLVAYPLNIILGVNFQFGGLNNLGNTSLVSNITTRNFSVFTGARLWF